MAEKPRASNSATQQELDKAEKQFEAYDANIKSMTLDRMNKAPKQDVDQQTKIAQQDIEKSKDLYLKPDRSISSPEPFNEKYRDAYNHDMEYVHMIAENREIIGETIELWTKPYAGMPCQRWKVPVNKPIWAPRHVAERIKACNYHRFTMSQHIGTGLDHAGQYYGAMTVDTTIQRLDAYPVSTKKTIFMGSNNF